MYNAGKYTNIKYDVIDLKDEAQIHYSVFVDSKKTCGVLPQVSHIICTYELIGWSEWHPTVAKLEKQTVNPSGH